MKTQKITIIGGGNLGKAIAEGLLTSGSVSAENLTITRRRYNLLHELAGKGINVTSDNVSAVSGADLVLIAVKPYQIIPILKDITDTLSNDQIVISLVAGVDLARVREITGQEIPVFRAMPNTAIAIQESMTCVASNGAEESQVQKVVALFDKLG